MYRHWLTWSGKPSWARSACSTATSSKLPSLWALARPPSIASSRSTASPTRSWTNDLVQLKDVDERCSSEPIHLQAGGAIPIYLDKTRPPGFDEDFPPA